MPAKTESAMKKFRYSHIYNESVPGQPIFRDAEDYEVFVSYLESYLTPPKGKESVKKEFVIRGTTYHGIPYMPKNYNNSIEIVSFLLTPDHFHLLIKQSDKKTLENFLRSLFTRYSMYFNKKHLRKGRLFIGPYKSKYFNKVTTLLYLTHYIFNEYLYRSANNKNAMSSYENYIKENSDNWINTKDLLKYFETINKSSIGGSETFQKFIEEYKLDSEKAKIVENYKFDEKQFEEIKKVFDEVVNEKPISQNIDDAVNHKNNKLRIKTFALISTFTALYIVLTAYGLKNVMSNVNAKSTTNLVAESQPASQVQGVNTSDESDGDGSLSYGELKALLDETSPTDAPSVNDEQQQNTLVITIDDNSYEVAIRKSPSLYGDIIGTAEKGQIFEFTNIVDGWFEINFENTVGYISPKYAKTNEEIN